MIAFCHNGYTAACNAHPEVVQYARDASLLYGTYERNEDGAYTVPVPLLPGCISEASTWEEASNHIEEAIAGYIDVAERYGVVSLR